MDNLLEIPKTPEKEIFTVKHNGKYYAAITGEQSIFVSPEIFDSPLKASNHARALKRQHKIDVKIKKDEKTKVVNNTAKILRKKQLYTEAEMASETKLKFREVWLILGPTGQYASKVLKENTVVNYVKDKDKAQTYRTYEDAIITLNVLDKVIRKGHQLRRFFERIDN
jgi:hypothetical protein